MSDPNRLKCLDTRDHLSAEHALCVQMLARLRRVADKDQPLTPDRRNPITANHLIFRIDHRKLFRKSVVSKNGIRSAHHTVGQNHDQT